MIAMVEKSYFLNIFKEEAERGGRNCQSFLVNTLFSEKVKMFYYKTNLFACNLLD